MATFYHFHVGIRRSRYLCRASNNLLFLGVLRFNGTSVGIYVLRNLPPMTHGIRMKISAPKIFPLISISKNLRCSKQNLSAAYLRPHKHVAFRQYRRKNRSRILDLRYVEDPAIRPVPSFPLQNRRNAVGSVGSDLRADRFYDQIVSSRRPMLTVRSEIGPYRACMPQGTLIPCTS
jgi:hypothetical protein